MQKRKEKKNLNRHLRVGVTANMLSEDHNQWHFFNKLNTTGNLIATCRAVLELVINDHK